MSTPQAPSEFPNIEGAIILPHHTTDHPILNLHDDILWHIFMINAVPEVEYLDWGHVNQQNTPALQTARLTSQVCRRWRAVVLGSPSIWANAINLQLLQQKSDHWRNEVLKRTGSAPLWISGNISSDDENFTSFLSVLFNDHWTRIRGLDVRVFAFSSSDGEIWRSFRSAAPKLELFSVHFLSTADPSSLTTQDPDDFFSGKAPLIRKFHCPRLAFSISAPWIPQLHAITLSYPLSIYDLFSAVNMPLLETLDIRNSLQIMDSRVPGNPLNKKVFPRLKTITLDHGFKTCLTILGRITASPRCALQLFTNDSDLTDVTSEEIFALQAILTDYSKGHFNTTSAQALILHLSANVFSISEPTRARIHPSKFSVNIYSTLSLPLDIFSPCLRSFSPCNFSCVTNFRFFIFLDYETYQSDIVNLISALPSVEVLHVTKNAIRILLDLPKEQRTVFPLLHTLTLGYRENMSNTAPPAYHDILLSFLTSRRDDGLPIGVLDLAVCPLGTLGNLGFLEEMKALKVRWKRANGSIDEYICGSGTPNILDL